MRITKVEVIPTRVPILDPILHFGAKHFEPWIVRMHTDVGLIGLGETRPNEAEELKQRCTGHHVAEFLHDDSIGHGLIAIYDIIAQAAGVPVAKIFSKSPRNRIQPTWWSACLPPKVLQDDARRALDRGFRVHKTKARPYEDPVEQMAALAEIVPNDYVVWLDANSTFYSTARTLQVAKDLYQFPFVQAFEEPIPAPDLDGYRRLRKELPLRLAVHWGDARVNERVFVMEKLVDAFVVEDYLWGRGMLKKTAVTQANHQQLWVENGLPTGITRACQAHQAAAFGFEYVISQTNILEDDLVVEPYALKDGFYYIPDKPGLGVTLDENALDRYRTG